MKNIIVKPSATSALVTWSIVTRNEDSSYITDYDIYLNRKHLKTIARRDHGTQFNITGLKPYSDYKVGILALDGSSQKSKIRYSEGFKTIEAGKQLSVIRIMLAIKKFNIRFISISTAQSGEC